jgi:type IV pilus assembly protein PilW
MSIRIFRSKNRAAGFSLVEIMVSLVISLVILGGAITVMQQNQRNFRHNDDFGRLQENTRFTLEILTSDVRMAGFTGCVRNNRLNGPAEQNKVRNNLAGIVDNSLLDLQYAIDGWEGNAPNWSARNGMDNSPESVDTAIWPRTDAITIRRMRGRGVPITQDMITTADNLSVPDDISVINDGEIAAIYNCEATDIFQAFVADPTTILHTGGINNTNVFSIPYKQNSAYTDDPDDDPEGYRAKTFVSAFDAVRYYLAASTIDPARTSLWRLYHNGANVVSQELVDGVENMQFLYGVDTSLDGAVDTYTTADNVPGWNQVVSVKIGLLISMVDEVGTEVDSKTYDLLGTGVPVGPFNDRRTRKMVSATVALQNLQPKVTDEL